MKRSWDDGEEESEQTYIQEVVLHASASAMRLGETLRNSQRAGDEAAVQHARKERVRKSAGIFQGDAGLAAGLQKMKEQITGLDHRCRELAAAIAMPLPSGEVMVDGQTTSLAMAKVRQTQLREEQGRLKGAVYAVGAHMPKMLSTIRQLATDGDLRGEIVPHRGARPTALIDPHEPEDTIVHHYVGDRWRSSPRPTPCTADRSSDSAPASPHGPSCRAQPAAAPLPCG